ncbi:B3 domain-containing protein REM1 [Cardamine amara subsp. amara]|uniref:B3 domain-containing protein REM1 n=1 Tax=Cardamine amara subsp. amara TaxID=228776 RepID=A0ABD1AUM4_CARAN
MADPPHFSLFRQIFLTGDKPLLMVDDDFLKNHTKVLLRSDASERTWKVKLNGDKLTDGWEEFASDHKFKDSDVLVFKHYGDETFHVSVASGDIHHASSSHVDTEDTYIDDDYVDDDDDDDNLGNILEKKNKKPEADSSSDNSCFIKTRVTPYSLHNDRLDLSRTFTVLYGEHKKASEIDLVNEHGRKWTLRLAKNSSSGVFYIRQGWEKFCSTNELRQGELCKFKLVENGERPLLYLCPKESGNSHEEECPEADALKNGSVGGGCSKEKSMLDDEVSKAQEKKTPSSFLRLNFTISRYKTGQLSLPKRFTCENGIKNSGETILLNKDGRKWPSYLQMAGRRGGGNEWFYLRRGWREMCEANGVNVYDSFMLELIWNDETPMFKFCSKIENHENKGKRNRRTRKKRACETSQQPRDVKKSRREDIEGRVNKKASRRPEHQDDEKRGRARVSNSFGKCRTELETREQNLEASLHAVDALGERILGISKILNNNLV